MSSSRPARSQRSRCRPGRRSGCRGVLEVARRCCFRPGVRCHRGRSCSPDDVAGPCRRRPRGPGCRHRAAVLYAICCRPRPARRRWPRCSIHPPRLFTSTPEKYRFQGAGTVGPNTDITAAGRNCPECRQELDSRPAVARDHVAGHRRNVRTRDRASIPAPICSLFRPQGRSHSIRSADRRDCSARYRLIAGDRFLIRANTRNLGDQKAVTPFPEITFRHPSCPIALTLAAEDVHAVNFVTQRLAVGIRGVVARGIRTDQITARNVSRLPRQTCRAVRSQHPPGRCWADHVL